VDSGGNRLALMSTDILIVVLAGLLLQ